MKSTEPQDQLKTRLSAVIALLDRNLKYVSSLGLDASLLDDYQRLIAYLRTRHANEIARILEASTGSSRPSKHPAPELSDADIEQLSNERLEILLRTPALKRSELERIATLRFSITRGALSNLRSRDALKEKLLTLLAHEGTHDAISRAAAAGPSGEREGG